ncbi:MAG: hypothetical protein HGA31_05575 [Candidatus Moranbacteria bacterium]|nr:hypothetical protein [Candidatus Moranbacteria bacterium]
MNSKNPLIAGMGRRVASFDELPPGTYTVLMTQRYAGNFILYLEQENAIVIVDAPTWELQVHGIPKLPAPEVDVVIIAPNVGAVISSTDVHEYGEPLIYWKPSSFAVYPNKIDNETAFDLDPEHRYLIEHAFLKEEREFLIIRTEDGGTAIKELSPAREFLYTFEQIIMFIDEFELCFEDRNGTYVESIKILLPA